MAPEAVRPTLLPAQNEAGDGDTLTVGALQGVNVYVCPLVHVLAVAVLVSRMLLAFVVPTGGFAHVSEALLPTWRLLTCVAKVLFGPRRPTCGMIAVLEPGPWAKGP